MSNNPENINNLLAKIGLIKNGKPLAVIRDYGIQDNNYDLELRILPSEAASIVEKKLGVKAEYCQTDGSEYWNFTIPNEWIFHLERYQSGSNYMRAFDLTEIKPK